MDESAIPLLIVGGMSIINTRVDLIMLGAINPEEVAVYAIMATRLRIGFFFHFWLLMQ